MSVDLTREQLYDLVWSTPMMHAAKKLQISGSMLSRICRQRNVPCPPRGYWAKLNATSSRNKGRYIKPSLPNLPEPRDSFNSMLLKEYAEREAARTDQFDPEDLNVPIKPPPPEPHESISEFLQRIETMFPELPAPETLKTRHPIVQKLMDFDVTLAALKKRGGWDSPNYQDEKGKQCLTWLNVLFNSFEALGFDVILRGKKNFSFVLNFLGHHMGMVIFVSENTPTLVERKYKKQKPTITFGFRWEQGTEKFTKGRNYYEFQAITTNAIKQIVMDVVRYDEIQYRERVVRSYELRVDRRKQEIKWRQQQIEEAAEKNRLALQELLARRESLMNEAIAGIHQADLIRSLIETMQTKSQASKKPIKDFDRWVSWATHHANTLDPRYMSVHGFEAWVAKFKLKH